MASNPDQPNPRPTLTVREAAALHGVSVQRIDALIRQGRLEVVRYDGPHGRELDAEQVRNFRPLPPHRPAKPMQV